MAKYVLVYNGGNTPASMQDRAVLMQAWRDWVGGLGSVVLDPGNPFGPSTAIATAGAVSELAQGCPHRTINVGTIEVYETLPID